MEGALPESEGGVEEQPNTAPQSGSDRASDVATTPGATPPVDRNERPLGGDRAIGAPRARPGSANADGKYGGLAMGDYVPTTREIESGAVQVREVEEVKNTDSVDTADLAPPEDPDQQFQFVVDNMKTKNWADRFDVLRILRQFVKLSPDRVEPLLGDIDKFLVDSMKNPRSSVIRESLQLVQDFFGCSVLKQGIITLFTWPKVFAAVLQKAINDKKFLAAEGLKALDTFATGAPENYRLLLKECDNRNAKISAVALRTVVRCIEMLGECLKDIDPVEEGVPQFQPLVTCSVKAMLKGKLADLRDNGKVCLEKVIEVSGGWSCFEALYGPKISSADMKQVSLALKPAEVANEEAQEDQEVSPASTATFYTPEGSPKVARDAPVQQEALPAVAEPSGQTLGAVAEPATASVAVGSGATPRSRRSSETCGENIF